MSEAMNARAVAFPTAFSPLDVKGLCTKECVEKYSEKLKKLKEWSGPQFEASDDIYSEMPAELTTNPARNNNNNNQDGAVASACSYRPPPPFRHQTSSAYELFAVVAHANGDAEHGKFIAFVKVGKPYNTWMLFDDANVTQVTEFEVRSLKGNGSSSSSVNYLMFYRSFDPEKNGQPPQITIETSSRYNFSGGAGDNFGGRSSKKSCGGGGGG